ncbi:phosphoribosylformylglycinamidine synthase [Candidatus Epulonipiscium fishelsonii]|uniref:Phosphoribosylformylglycinamidine synthase n=1 Tax=Candidatus Epulonipiscium fishelsonii TaxID=77094 RepID=A0ACC8X9P5_9FIRM|nr:phosphoribosylformylglycinamidine synthase [Epulopiscium sp. SCG-D08WGA-EpuloA1]
MVYSVYSTKKREFADIDNTMLNDIKIALNLDKLKDLQIFNRYEVENISEDVFKKCIPIIFSEPQVDDYFDELPEHKGRIFGVQYLPGQFDQRADSCEQCIQFITQGERPTVRTARIIYLWGEITDEQFDKLVKYVINPVESMQANLEIPETLKSEIILPTTVEKFIGFTSYNEDQLQDFLKEYSLAMDLADIEFCQEYFKKENRDPSITEIRMIDTYWSDHCRHTTFTTILENIKIENNTIQKVFDKYLKIREELYVGKDTPITLMDMACIGLKYLKSVGLVTALDESEEINACSVKVDVDVDGKIEPWLVMFKNETHNHPTEIEPFGGSATCLGGAIRDPLSGRSYVYQAMRITGAGNPLVSVEKTLKGKLPQSKIVTVASQGYSSYGNQVGLATGLVDEIYHDGYIAKHLEVGAVIGAAPAENVIRETPTDGDIIILLGGRTGRDGCGGATGSSKSHEVTSLSVCGSQVQKGNAPEERKIQRLFRKKEVTTLIKRCNDFGAGGVSVAIGELADGIDINLDLVPKKYEGLDATELAISESQERMAVVVNPKDVEKFIEFANEENLEATVVAKVTNTNRLRMVWNGDQVVDLCRDFLNSNGAKKYMNVEVVSPYKRKKEFTDNLREQFEAILKDLNICSKRGLIEKFDSTIGARTVLMPLGGKNQLTPTQSMVAKIPVENAETTTCTIKAYGFDPDLSEHSPFDGAYYSVVHSLAKIVASGGNIDKCWSSYQEYFRRLGTYPKNWGLPFASLLGALKAQLDFKVPAIGGKDSMSGTFEDLHVPNTLIAFSLAIGNVNDIISPEFKQAGNYVYNIFTKYNEDNTLDSKNLIENFKTINKLIKQKKIISAYATSKGGICEAVAKMAFGNDIGVKINIIENKELFEVTYGSIIVEAVEAIDIGICIGKTIDSGEIIVKNTSENVTEVWDIEELKNIWSKPLEPIYSSCVTEERTIIPTIRSIKKSIIKPKVKFASPKVLIPVFPGTNCEYDLGYSFEKEGATIDTFVINNLTPAGINQSLKIMEQKIKEAQIIALPGGFSGGDEPEGSGKFITAFLRNERMQEAIHSFLNDNDGLMLGICNGFQALIKLGLVPFGKIVVPSKNNPTLTFNKISRHQSRLVNTRVCAHHSPWFMHTKVGEIHTVPISHGEGRFIASSDMLETLIENGQITTQYIDEDETPTLNINFNPNASMMAIEGVTSPDGRVLGKMGHTERFGENLYKNVPRHPNCPIFKGAVDYFL